MLLLLLLLTNMMAITMRATITRSHKGFWRRRWRTCELQNVSVTEDGAPWESSKSRPATGCNQTGKEVPNKEIKVVQIPEVNSIENTTIYSQWTWTWTLDIFEFCSRLLQNSKISCVQQISKCSVEDVNTNSLGKVDSMLTSAAKNA